jgi:DNA-directed RNA polymerase specialized sigma24 family protein
MQHRAPKLNSNNQFRSTESVLEQYYEQLQSWGLLLARGDTGRAQDIVHDLCLHFSLTQPDLANVSNLDGYLYTSLRHIYLSSLARASRDAARFVSVAEFDSFESALLLDCPADLLQRQNDLRRICSYALWRKEDSKASSYFILHFFHGYQRHEIAELAILPVPSIYSKLKSAREEMKAYLSQSDKLRFTHRRRPPVAISALRAVSSPELFRQIRGLILSARNSDCISEQNLLAHYQSVIQSPISSALLSHLVSCERCLDILDRHFRRPSLKDREPLDGFGSASERSGGDDQAIHRAVSRQQFFCSLRRRRERIFDHDPATLSIAVNGRIVARHDIRGGDSVLSARVERPELVQFVEVFADPDVRLALLSIEIHPPAGPHQLTRSVYLSDSRSLELNLSFDGLGLNCDAVYFDPSWQTTSSEEFANELVQQPPFANEQTPSQRESAFASIVRFLKPRRSSPVLAWALLLMGIFCLTGYWIYRQEGMSLSAEVVLRRSVAVESVALKGETEHRVLRFEEVSSDQRFLRQGTIETWRDGDHNRYARRVFDQHRRLIAADSQNAGKHDSYRLANKAGQHGNDSLNPVDELLDQDLSAERFAALKGQGTRIQIIGDGYELTKNGPTNERPQLVTASLVLDKSFRPLREILREHRGNGTSELRLVQTSYERSPSRSVPDAVFDLELEARSHHSGEVSSLPPAAQNDSTVEVRLTELQIAALYELNKLGADTSDPIEVVREEKGRIRISGSVRGDDRRRELLLRLASLQDHQLLDIQLLSPSAVKTTPAAASSQPIPVNVYELNPTHPAVEPLLRRYFESHGVSGDKVDTDVMAFCREALEHGQRAVQHAYALDRLGSQIPAAQLSAISISGQRQWSEMVSQHATALTAQLRGLRDQLATISPGDTGISEAAPIEIEDPIAFAHNAENLSRRVQELDHKTGESFAASSGSTPVETDRLLTLQTLIPLNEASQVKNFANRLNNSTGNHK